MTGLREQERQCKTLHLMLSIEMTENGINFLQNRMKSHFIIHNLNQEFDCRSGEISLRIGSPIKHNHDRLRQKEHDYRIKTAIIELITVSRLT